MTGSKDSLDESWRDTAIREVQEETGIEVGCSTVPESALVDWAIENVYEIYPIWRARYAPVSPTTPSAYSACRFRVTSL